MKDLFLLLLLASLAAPSFGQNRLKGPQAKNYNPIHQKVELASTPVQTDLKLKGPQAKNRKVFKTNTGFAVRSQKPLKGPQAKNRQVLKPTAPAGTAFDNLVKSLPALMFGRPF